MIQVIEWYCNFERSMCDFRFLNDTERATRQQWYVLITFCEVANLLHSHNCI